MAHYSNRTDLLAPLVDVLQRIEEKDRTEEPGVQSTARSTPARPLVRDRLTEDDMDRIVSRFRAGTAKHVLADEYGISLSSVKRLIRKHGP
jgi:hypothetical protein